PSKAAPTKTKPLTLFNETSISLLVRLEFKAELIRLTTYRRGMSSEGRTTEQEFLSSRWGAWEHSSPGTRNNHRVENVPLLRVDRTQPYSNLRFLSAASRSTSC